MYPNETQFTAQDIAKHVHSLQIYTFPHDMSKSNPVSLSLNFVKIPDETDETDDAVAGLRPAVILADQLNNVLLVSGILLSPLVSLANLPAVAANMPFKTIGLVACMADLTAIVSAAAFRLRLKTLSRSGEDEQFVKKLRDSWSDSCLATSSPMLLIATAMLLFMLSISGSLVVLHPSQDVENSFGTVESIILCLGGIFSLAHCGFMLRSINELGRPRASM